MQIHNVNNQPSFRAGLSLNEIEIFNEVPKLISDTDLSSLTGFAAKYGTPHDTFDLTIRRTAPKLHCLGEKTTVIQTGYIIKGRANIDGIDRPIEMCAGSFGDGLPSPIDMIKATIQSYFK